MKELDKQIMIISFYNLSEDFIQELRKDVLKDFDCVWGFDYVQVMNSNKSVREKLEQWDINFKLI